MKRIFLLLALFSVFLILSMSAIPSSQVNIVKEEIKNNIISKIKYKVEYYFSNYNKKNNIINYYFQSVFLPVFIIIYVWLLGISIIFNLISTMISEKKIFLTIVEILNSIRLGLIDTVFIFLPFFIIFAFLI